MNYKYFVHDDCSFYPCHEVMEEWKSCLFCWCPLYLLECGGDYVMTRGMKDCTTCAIPHTAGGYEYVFDVVNSQVYQKMLQF